MGEREAFEHILASLHEAALDDTHWPAASALIDDALGVHGNCLVYGDANSREDIRIYYAGFFYRGERHREWEREYFDVYFPWTNESRACCNSPTANWSTWPTSSPGRN